MIEEAGFSVSLALPAKDENTITCMRPVIGHKPR